MIHFHDAILIFRIINTKDQDKLVDLTWQYIQNLLKLHYSVPKSLSSKHGLKLVEASSVYC